jgi:DNA-binding transcriptional MerR regulator
MVANADLLEPVDVRNHLQGLDLTLGQVCQVAGISKMQLDYWTQKASIPTHGKKQRTYDLNAVETVLLIKQAKDRGLSLSAAIDAVREFQARQAARAAPAPRRAAQV